MSTTRVEGQIWIDKNSPYKLKYHVNGQDYIVETSATYPVGNVSPDESGVILHAGEVVALDSNGTVKLAKFPNDIRKVLGVSLSDVRSYNKDLGVGVLQTGYLDLEHPEKLFVDDSLNSNAIEGAPVYWDTYNAGKLTLCLPNGSYPDDSVVHYGNLPQIGTLARDYEIGEHLYVHINMMSFETTIDWYVEQELNIDTGETESDAGHAISKTLDIEHGLIRNSTDQCHVDITAIHNVVNGAEVSQHEHPALAYVSNTYSTKSSPLSVTSITVKSPEQVTFRINGRVSYGKESMNAE